MSHTCKSLVVSCIDFRIQQYISDWDKLEDGQFDRVEIAGGVKDVDYILKQVQTSYHLHGIKTIYLVNHEDCGAYGPNGTFEVHQKDLQKTKAEIVQLIPQLNILLYFLTLQGEFISID